LEGNVIQHFFPLEGIEVAAEDLQLADVVMVHRSAFGTAVVTKVEEREVELFRPYATTADFSYTGGVIPYIGIETYKLPRNNTVYTVVARKTLR
jgi:hypothetical protein